MEDPQADVPNINAAKKGFQHKFKHHLDMMRAANGLLDRWPLLNLMDWNTTVFLQQEEQEAQHAALWGASADAWHLSDPSL